MRRIDYAAVLDGLEAELVADPSRTSWGRSHLLELVASLKREHSYEESADEAVLRRFSGHLTDTFFGVSPRPGAPLAGDDRETSPSMADRTAHAMTGRSHDGSQYEAGSGRGAAGDGRLAAAPAVAGG